LAYERTSKNKIILWFLKKGVILTKDNLARRNWNGSKKCCFCSKAETIQHLFFECHYARFLWRAMYYVFGIKQPRHSLHFFNSWSHNQLLLIGGATLCWAIWLTRNDLVFDKCTQKPFCRDSSERRTGSGRGLYGRARMTTRVHVNGVVKSWSQEQ
jgi:hypothetical protein